MKSENSAKYSLFAAIAYIVEVLISIIITFFTSSNSNVIEVSFFWIIECVTMIAITAALFLKNKKALSVAYGVSIILRGISLPGVPALAYAVSVVILILLLTGNDKIKKIWFVPSAVFCLGIFIPWIIGRYFYYFRSNWFYVICTILDILGVLFVGMWVKGNVAPVKAEPANAHASLNSQPTNSPPQLAAVIGAADNLIKCKELLDAGILTQEEFDNQKKKLLGL